MLDQRTLWGRPGLLWLVVVALAIVAIGCDEGERPGRAENASVPATTGVADLVDDVAPSVVSVIVGPGQGSGVIYDKEGVIVTNAHVAAQGDDFVVGFADGTRVDAELVALDQRSDLAVLQADVDRELPAATFEEELPRVGDVAVAIGTPLGLENSVTAGIISGIDRSLPGAAAAGVPALVGLLQTDAGLSPGNSGGALVNAQGGVVGINVAAAGAREVAGGSIGFAIPTATVVDVVDQLVTTGEVTHPFLGVQLAPLTPAVTDRFDTAVAQGALVLAVGQGTPADESRIEPGDVIVGLGDADVTDPGDLLAALREHAPGETVAVTIYRRGEERTVDVTLGERPD